MRQFTSKADKNQLSAALLPTISLLAVLLLTLAVFFLRPDAVKADDTTYIRYGVGYYDAFDSYDATEFHIEILPGYHILDVVRPFTGVMATTDSATYGYAGLRAELDLAPQWQIVPAFAAGGYSDGDGKDLGHAVEFRSALEVNYQLNTGGRIGGSLYHLSNAGLDEQNPGTEVFTFHYSHPLQEMRPN